MGIASGIVAPGGTTTTDATAEQWHIKSGLDAYIASGKVTGNGYFPALMDFDGSTGYFSKVGATVSGNKFSIVIGFKVPALAATQRLVHIADSSIRAAVSLISSGDGTSPNTLRLFVQNSANSTVCTVTSVNQYADDALHVAKLEFDGDAGTASIVVDQTSDIDTGHPSHTVTTGTLETGTMTFAFGASTTPSLYTNGQLGFFGYRDVGGLTASDFMQTDGSPKPLDESTWTEWGAQPLFWHPSGKMDENLGSAGAMTKNGTITLADPTAWS